MLTVEAFTIYLRHLVPDGVIAVPISNQHSSLGPVVDAVSHAHHLNADFIRGGGGKTNGTRVLWTHDHASLLDVWLAE